MSKNLWLKAVLLVPLFCVLLAVSVNSQEGTSPATEPELSRVSELEKELAETLVKAYEGALMEFRVGRTTPEMLIRLNVERFDAELAIAPSDGRLRVAQQYVERAESLEKIAQAYFDAGVGTDQQRLTATAARLRAELELAKLSAVK
ncbi:MAG: hypothetical protein MI861_27910 [Pirellulales bacterium]|nr:hypothetical protein [Pirellulales bacterium]